jgi:hypothetical protein
MSFDAQCDVAAIVYPPEEDPDRLLIDFADDLRQSGLRPVGVVQAGRSCRSDAPRLGVVMLPGAHTARLVPDGELRRTGCCLDAGRLDAVAQGLAAAIGEGADLVIINRFGRSEVAGGGLIDVIARAVAADIPVLIAVPQRHFPAWLSFCGGMSVRLPCRREALDGWWHSLARRAAAPVLDRAGSAIAE